jgi:hypothetical protein
LDIAIVVTLAVFIFALEEWLALNHLCENASDRPHVDWCGIIFLSEKDFRGPLPDGLHPFCPGLSRQVKRTCKTEVDDLKNIVFIDHDVPGAEVSIVNASLMEIINCAQYLTHKLFHDIWANPFTRRQL